MQVGNTAGIKHDQWAEHWNLNSLFKTTSLNKHKIQVNATTTLQLHYVNKEITLAEEIDYVIYILLHTDWRVYFDDTTAPKLRYVLLSGNSIAKELALKSVRNHYSFMLSR